MVLEEVVVSNPGRGPRSAAGGCKEMPRRWREPATAVKHRGGPFQWVSLALRAAKGSLAQLGMQMCANGMATGLGRERGAVTIPASKDLVWAVHGPSPACWVTISSDLGSHTFSSHPALGTGKEQASGMEKWPYPSVS